MTVLGSGRRTITDGDRWLGHWIITLPILLALALLGIRQVDHFPPRSDEFFSMYNVGWIVDGPYAPINTLQLLVDNSPNQAPFYYLLLNMWGRLVGSDVATGRLLSLFAGLLSAAMIYRLTCDLASPIAGVFALTILASSAFLNFYLVYLHAYSLLLLNSTIVCWVYLKLLWQRRFPRQRQYVALAAASYALASTHAISVLLFVGLGVYHLLHVRKDRRWLNVAVAVMLSLALFAPWAVVMLSKGVGQWVSRNEAAPTISNTLDVFGSWMSIGFSGSATLLTVTILGLAMQLRLRCKRFKQILLILAYYALILALFTHFVGIIVPGLTRLTIPGFALLIPSIAISYYRLYRLRKLLGLFVILWLIAGIAYQQSGNWTRYLSVSGQYKELIPWQAVSRAVARSDLAGSIVMGYQFDPFQLNFPASIGYSQNEYYFARHGVEVRSVEDPHVFEKNIRFLAITEPSIWLMYRSEFVSPPDGVDFEAIMREAGYESCGFQELGIDVFLTEYRWQALDCDKPVIHSAHESDLIQYEFFSAGLSPAGDKVLFIDRWSAQDDFPAEGYNLSHQLIDADGENVAQLDLPLVNEGILRQFSIDVSGAPAGKYHLVAILYDSQTGERVDWLDSPSAPPTMLMLAELAIPT